MKNPLCFLLAAFCCTSLLSHDTTTWFVQGCQWKYGYQSISGPGEEIFEYAGTAEKGGQLCVRLHVYGYRYGTKLTRVYERLGGEHLIWWDIDALPLSEIDYTPGCYRDDTYPQADCSLSYTGFPTGTATWSEVNGGWCTINGIQYVLQGDTVLPGNGYGKKLYYRPTYTMIYPCIFPALDTVYNMPLQFMGVLHQDSSAKKVWYTRLSGSPGISMPCISNYFPFGQKVLLYDFDLEFGEELSWKPGANVYAGSDSIQLNDGAWRRRYFFADAAFEVDSFNYWIEGIGSNNSLFGSYMYPDLADLACRLNCFKEDNVLKYNVVNAAFCDSSSIVLAATEPASAIQLQLYPNPATGSVTVEITEDALPALARLFDAQGKLLNTMEINAAQTSLDLSSWKGTAVLFVHIQSADGRQAGRLLRVER